MKQYIITILFTILNHFSFSQWVTEEKYKEAYKDIDAGDTIWFEEKIPLIDTLLIELAQDKINIRKQLFYNSIDTLRKHKKYPDLKEYDHYLLKMRDSLPKNTLDSLRLINNKNFSINRNYRNKKNNAFKAIFNTSRNERSNYPVDSLLIDKHKDFILSELNKIVFLENRGYKRHQLYYSYIDIPESLKDSIKNQKFCSVKENITDARWGDTLAEQKIIKDFWRLVQDSIDYHPVDIFINKSFVPKYPEIRDKTIDLFKVNSKKTWDVFFNALQSDYAYYKYWDNEIKDYNTGELNVTFTSESLTSMLLRIYNDYFYNDIEYYNKYILKNWTFQDYAGLNKWYLEVVANYLSKKHKRKIVFKFKKLEWIECIPRDEFERKCDILPPGYKK